MRLLPLEALRPCWSEPLACVLIDQGRVLKASIAATAAGIRLEMRSAGVRALCPEALILERDEHKEALANDAIAMSLLRFTPEVSRADDFSFILDVTASLNLFGGYRSLYRQIRECITVLGFTVHIGMAPTAMAAWLLARAPALRQVRSTSKTIKLASMSKAIDRLPVSLLPAAQAHHAWLQGIGCQTIGDLRRLPRAGLLRRTSPLLLDALDKTYGLIPELFIWIKPPLSFSARIETHERIEHTDALLVGAHRLLLQLIGWLVSLQKAVCCFTLLLEHERGRTAIAPTAVEIVLAEAAWHEKHLLLLLKERLSKIELIAPVIALKLEVQQLVDMRPPTDALFPEPGGTPADFQRLLELLTARLGKESVMTPAIRPDHRPEQANHWLPAVEKLQSALLTDKPDTPLERPFWLLEKPLALAMRNERPFYGSALKIIKGPERIESGWYDDHMIARDYFIAQANDASCYWIFLERTQDPRWFLHGLFA